MNRLKVTGEKRLQELYGKLKEARRNEPFGFNAHLAQLAFQILDLERKLKIDNPDKQNDFIGIMLEHAFYMKTDRKDPYVAKQTFQQILRIDPHNAEANYRYAFLHYKDGNWTKAISFFKESILHSSPDFPLAEDQVVKAHLFISYSAMMLVKESMRAVDDLQPEESLETEGISIDQLSADVKALLALKEYRLNSNTGEEFISRDRYKELESNVSPGDVWVDLTVEEPYIQSGDLSIRISHQLGNLLKRLLLKSAKQEALPLYELIGNQEEMFHDSEDFNWDNYRQKIRRVKQKLVEVGLPERFIQSVRGTQSYRIEPCTFFIIQHDAE
ncbi:tetratricopeptide repeat protein [Sporosarcina siberiensis]|uniref:Tetratricopeptide repeat protein n=1 Tax=Sporosarcina siberiensis TaxID=1365606 RepID=A0ABW4SH37_9BACL